MEVIQSRQNPKIRLARGLRRKKVRVLEGLFLVEGIFHIGEALAAGAELEYALYSPALLKSDFAKKTASELGEKNVESFRVEAQILSWVSGKDESSGLIAIARQNYISLEEITPKDFQSGLAIVAPQDPGNVGSLLRSIDASGADGLILLDGGVDAYHPSAIRAGMGSHFWKSITQASFDDFVEWSNENGYKVYGSSTRGSVDFTTVVAEKPFVVLLGSEREGLSKKQLEACEAIVRIPMRGRTSSLNLATAGSILLYSFLPD